MIEPTSGNLLNADVEALVNTVNCVGYMGKGIALQFKQAFPDNYTAYRRACDRGEVQPGRMQVYETGQAFPRLIFNFPTKRDWRANSRIDDIEIGLQALIREIEARGVTSVAVPPLGCGNGGLNWRDVRPRIERAFAALPDVRVLLFSPSGAPAATTMPVRTTRPRMTLARALFIRLMEQYRVLNYRMTLLELQKLAYFLQEAGEPLKLRYVPGPYGPFAPNLNKVLELLEGHFIRGYGDSQKPDVEIALLPGGPEAATAFVKEFADASARLDRVSRLIEGFETPHSMELLATVHWVATRGDQPTRTLEDIVRAVHGWNARKARAFPRRHIEVTWAHLVEQGWLAR
ncbi:MAG: Appr-1-p processing protein [Chloroflexota bacterium]|nr:MAG: Appr-1-p processing protein [Chloroflexota bacterium]